jgi:predicted nucleotidyltransferase
MSTRTEEAAGVRLDDRLTREIVRRVLSVAQPDRVIVFGSAAAGTMTKDSDVDLLVLESGEAGFGSEASRIRDSLSGLGLPFDIIVMSTERFEETKGVIGGLAYPAAKYGKTLYEAGRGS